MNSGDLLAPLLIAARISIACIFVTTAAAKLRHLSVFQGVLANYRLLPRWAIAPLHVLLPLAEIAVGIAALLAPRPGAPCAALLFLLFASAMAINLRRGRRDIDCGCHHSALRQQLSWTLVGRNAVLALTALATALPAGPAGPSAWLTGIPAGACSFVLYSAMSSLWALGSNERRRIRIAGVSP